MSIWIEFIKAGTKVAYDKASQYIGYLVGGGNGNSNESREDSIRDYGIDYNKYNNEENSNRIYPEVGLLTEYSYMVYPPTHIIDNIYLGSAFNAASYNLLKELDIRVIFNITNEITNYYPDDFIYHKYDLNDDNRDSICEHLEVIYNLIKGYQNEGGESGTSSGNIFVHCYMGRSRSASIVIYYVMKKLGCGFDEAVEYVIEKRPIVNPTFRFTKDLAGSMLGSD